MSSSLANRDSEKFYTWFARMTKHIELGETHEDCMIWTGAKDENGYGIARDWDGKVRRVHIQFYEYNSGAPVPDGEVVDHECRVRACCNFRHLQSKTRRENTLIGVGPTALNALKTHCSKCNTPYDEENTQWHSGRRECKKCNKERQKARRLQARAEKADSESWT